MTVLIYLLFIPAAFFIRELAYLMAALVSGVGLSRFQIGIGPRLLKWNMGRTRVSLHAIPIALIPFFLGGNKGAQDALDVDDDDYGLFAKGYGKRLLFFLSGAVLLMSASWGLLFAGIFINPPPASLVGGVTIPSPAADAGLHTGDRITTVNGKPVQYLFDLFTVVYQNGGAPVEMEIVRNGERFKVTLAADECFGPRGEFFPDRLGVEAPSLTRVAEVIPGQPADVAGIRSGDWIREVADVPVRLWSEVVTAVQQHPAEKIEVVVERQGARRTLKIEPTLQIVRDTRTGQAMTDDEGNPLRRAMIGAVGDMGTLQTEPATVRFALARATQQLSMLTFALPTRAVAYLMPEGPGQERSATAITIDLEQGLVESARPWHRAGAEFLVLFGVLMLPYSFVQAARGRRMADSLLAEEDA